MNIAQYLNRLDQRRRYLEGRVALKKSMGWDYAYDQDEHDALQWAVTELQATQLEHLVRPWQIMRAKQSWDDT